MAHLEIERMICADIDHQLENAQRDERYGYHEAYLYRCKNAKRFCEDLITQLDEIIKEG